MRKAFDVYLWQHVVESLDTQIFSPSPSRDTALFGSVERERLATASEFGGDSVFLKCDFRNEQIAETFSRLGKRTPPIIPSRLKLEGWVAAGHGGLLLDLVNGRCLIGDAVGWGLGYAEQYARSLYSAIWDTSRTSFLAEIPEPMPARSIPADVFISAPGQRIYGHWLLDVIPRISMMKKYSQPASRIFGAKPPVWAQTFVDALGVSFTDLSDDAPNQIYCLDDYNIPSFLKSGYIIHKDICRDAWADLAATMLERPSNALLDYGPKIFVTRSRLQNNSRQIANIDAVERFAAQQGYSLLAPETLSIEEQANIFNRARVVLGQDGSALHNVIFSRPGTVLGVINLSSRCNLWHASICDVLGHKIAFTEATTEVDGKNYVKLHELQSFISNIENAATV